MQGFVLWAWHPCKNQRLRLHAGVTLYGTPCVPTHPRARENTNNLLTEAVAVLRQMDGPKCSGGDLNHDLSSLPAVQELEQLGFREVQDIWFDMTGEPPKATCKLKTRRDFLFVSQELVPWVSGVRVNYHTWVDHATLVASFTCNVRSFDRFPWTFPQPLPWKKVVASCPSMPVHFDSDDPSSMYLQFWKGVEANVVDVLHTRGVHLDAKSFGRARYTEPRCISSSSRPVAVGRQGELTPGFFGVSMLHKHWFRQARRLQSFVRLVGVAQRSSNHIEHTVSLWRAILQAPGFKPDFASWWTFRHKTVGEISMIPQHPPSAAIALEIFRALEWEVRQLESRLKKCRRGKTKRQGVSLQQLFREVKRDAPETVDVLLQTKTATVIEIRHDDASLVLDKPVSFDAQRPIVCAGRPLALEVVTPDQLWVSDVCELDRVPIGAAVVQRQATGRLADVFHAFIEQWNSRWGRHRNVPLSQWNDIISFAQQHLGTVVCEGVTLTVPLVRAVARSKKHCAAIGLDGVSRADVNLDANQIQALILFFHTAHQQGAWPKQMLQSSQISCKTN